MAVDAELLSSHDLQRGPHERSADSPRSQQALLQAVMETEQNDYIGPASDLILYQSRNR